MTLATVSCNNCGAPLQIPQSAKYVTCNHCATQLTVKKNESVMFTEKLDSLSERTERIEDEVAAIRQMSELQRIDREWELEKENYMVTNKHGHRHVPSVAGSVFGGLLAAVFGIVFTVIASNVNGAMAAFGVFFVLFGIGSSIVSYSKAHDYLAAERRYYHRRKEARRRDKSD